MSRLRNAAVSIASSGVLAACAAVTGLGDYEVVDCAGACGEAGPDAITTADAFVPATPNDSGVTDATVPPADSGDASVPVDSGDAGVDAGPPAYTPSCARTSCAGIAAPSVCTEESCDTQPKWQRDVQTTGNIRSNAGECMLDSGGSGSGRASLVGRIPGGSRYHFELRFRGSKRGNEVQSGPIATITSGTTTITLQVTNDNATLCVNADCGPATNVPGLGANDGFSAHVDIYGWWGDSVTNGYVRLVAGAPGACTARYERALPKAASGEVEARLGCLAAQCDTSLDEISFSQTPF